MKIDFYYWAAQCPISYETLSLLDKYKDKMDIHMYNVENDYDLAKRQKMFFPFLTVINDEKRFRAPITQNFLEKLLNGEKCVERPYIIDLGKEKFNGEVVPLTKKNISLLSKKCTMTGCSCSCDKKALFLSKYCDEIYGFLNKDSENVLGGVEYIPSIYVPYDIPKSDDYAFLTCIYYSSTEYDYKYYPLIKLESYLKEKYSKVFAITEELGTFPNGNLKWFLDNGYNDEGLISVEKDYCRLHLVSKNL
ncbi:hypothetical protein JYG23_03740 [Sedimentibacter sp. zth1]|uniref:hypothetical protein n=1 Tax=Sedimentibacter sp. zth1 TaxID=2816908 RepID=UPI001A90DA2C|nr:hypothetical protein [Sedimentibacter sp. zth1]QSX06579.1 hypothetical protein JYG23_03740 [Sedimentibacter sp. zth1]